MQVSMSVHVNRTFASDTLFHTASSPVNFEFWFPIHCTRAIARFFPSSFSLFFYLFAIKYFPRSLSLFTFPIFLEGTYLRVGFLTIRSQGTPLFRYIFTIVISIYLDFCSFFPIFSIVRIDETHTRVLYTWPSLLFCPQKMIFIIICVLISAVILVAIIVGFLPG